MKLIKSLKLRHHKLKLQLKKKRINSFLISDPYNLKYLTGVHSLSHFDREVFILATKKKFILLTSPLVADKFTHLHKQFTILSFSKQNTLSNLILNSKYETIHFEAGDLRVAELSRLKQKSNFNFKPVPTILQELRIIKDAYEITQIKKACQITKKTWQLLKPKIKPGLSEIELADLIITTQKSLGAHGIPLGFDPIIAAGPNSAIPHHSSSTKKIKSGDVVLVDFGCSVNGYCSDFTRTIFIGKPTKQFSKVESIVIEAYNKAISKLTNKTKSSELDLSVRNTFSRYKLENNFLHTTGHGLGLNIHEPPSISQSSTQTNKPNSTITIEPGLYFPGKLGYRHENTILITKDSHQTLT